MDQHQFTTGINQFKQALDEDTLNRLGKQLKFAYKLRKATPYRLALSLLSSFAEKKIETIADTHRAYNQLNATDIQYKPYHNQLAKQGFPQFMRSTVCCLLGKLCNQALTFSKDSPFSRFKKISIHDGTAYGINSRLKKHYPGKFKVQAPAAVQLHVTMNLLEDEISVVTLTSYMEAERHYAPSGESLKDSLLLADRNFLDISYFKEIDDNNGFFIVRGKRHLNPVIIHAEYAEGKKINRFCGKKLRTIRLSKSGVVDLTAQWKVSGNNVNYRLIIFWNKQKKQYTYLVTNLARELFSAQLILLAYRLRWQIELLFKEWKSYANLKKFNTANPNIAEGLIWAALGAAIIKRFMAHLTQQVKNVPISTRIVAMSIGRLLSTLFEKKLKNDMCGFKKCFMETINFISINAKRTNLKRYREKGRAKLGCLELMGALKN